MTPTTILSPRLALAMTRCNRAVFPMLTKERSRITLSPDFTVSPFDTCPARAIAARMKKGIRLTVLFYTSGWTSVGLLPPWRGKAGMEGIGNLLLLLIGKIQAYALMLAQYGIRSSFAIHAAKTSSASSLRCCSA